MCFSLLPNVSLQCNDFRLVIRMNTKRKARNSSDSSTSGNSPAEKERERFYQAQTPHPNIQQVQFW